MLGTYFKLVDLGQRFFEPLDVFFFRFIGQSDGLGQRLIYKIFREDTLEFAAIANGEGVEPLLDDLQLGSIGVDVGHSERVRFVIANVAARESERGSVSDGFLI